MKRLIIIGLCMLLLIAGCGESGESRLNRFKESCESKNLTYFDDNIIVPLGSYRCLDDNSEIHEYSDD